MPEMPEVEQVRKTLAPRITNKKITVSCDRMELGRETLEEERLDSHTLGAALV